MDPIPMSAPYRGLNQQLPVEALDPPFASDILNFNVTIDGVELRKGDLYYTNFAHAAGALSAPVLLVPYGNTKLFMPFHNGSTNKIDIRDVDAGTTPFSSSTTGALDIFTSSYFNNYLYVWASNAHKPGFVYDGSSWSTIGYTGSGTFKPFGGCVHKTRQYMPQLDEAAYWYTSRSASTGACTKVDLTDIIQEKGTLITIAPVSLADTITATTVLAFVFDSGEVLFYAGSYPDSADWQQVGTGKISQPISYNYVRFQRDSLILTDDGVVSLRNLFTTGQADAATLTMSAPIQSSWTAFVKAMRSYLSVPNGPINPVAGGIGFSVSVKGLRDAKNNRLIIQFPGYIESDGDWNIEGGSYFIFNYLIDSWVPHRSFGAVDSGLPFVDICSYKNKILMVGVSLTRIIIWEKEGSTDFTDAGTDGAVNHGYDYRIVSPAVRDGRTYVQKADGMDLIIKTDLWSETTYQFVSEFGLQETTAQKIPSMGTGIVKALANMGIEGSHIQYKISGTTSATKAVGYKLYSTNIWREMGRSPR